MKKQNIFSRILDAITLPFISLAVLVDESRLINDDGSWDDYWEKRSSKEAKKEKRRGVKNTNE